MLHRGHLGFTTQGMRLRLKPKLIVNGKITSFTNTFMLQSSPHWGSADVPVKQVAVE